MLPNFAILTAAALIPLILGYLWFHPKVFGGDFWYDLTNLKGADRSEVSTIKLLSTLILNFFIAWGLFGLTIHQFGAFSMVGGDAELLKTGVGGAFMSEYGSSFLSFGHGALHAVLQACIGFVIPVLGYVTIFEKKSFRYFLVYLGYWVISLILMGGVVGQWGAVMA